MFLENLLDKGGPIVLILLGYSMLALVLVLERLFFFIRLGRPGRDFENELVHALHEKRAEESLQNLRGPEVRVVQGMLRAAGTRVRDLGRVAERLGSQELQRMERGFRTLGVLGNTAPLLGLLGTIVGMIKAFMVIEQSGGRVDAQALAGGIWEALLTTGVGLAVAIPVLLLLHMLESMADRRTRSMRNYASLVLEHLPSGTGPRHELQDKDTPRGENHAL